MSLRAMIHNKVKTKGEVTSWRTYLRWKAIHLSYHARTIHNFTLSLNKMHDNLTDVLRDKCGNM